MILNDLLLAKGTNVYTIEPSATVQQAVERLVEYNIGSLLICEPGDEGDAPQLVGILTERDILRLCAANSERLREITVEEVMTRDVIIAGPGDSIAVTMGLMTDNRVRHLPVVEDDSLRGLISIGDVVKAQYQELMLENHYLKSYLQS